MDKQQLVIAVEEMIADWDSEGDETYRELAARIVEYVLGKNCVDVNQQLG